MTGNNRLKMIKYKRIHKFDKDIFVVVVTYNL